jgi:antibiotic biosynthesis monooxygenase (ABM) superfamily enzyme
VNDTATAAMKIVLEWRVQSGEQERFEAWLRGLVAHAADAEGYEGSSVLSAKDDYFLLLRFATAATLQRWHGSAATAALLATAAPMATPAQRVQVRTGLETWFALPGHPELEPPPKWKMALVTWLALLPQVLLLGAVLPPLPYPLRPAVSTAIPVALLTWVVMPRLRWWLRRWLYPQATAA